LLTVYPKLWGSGGGCRCNSVSQRTAHCFDQTKKQKCFDCSAHLRGDCRIRCLGQEEACRFSGISLPCPSSNQTSPTSSSSSQPGNAVFPRSTVLFSGGLSGLEGKFVGSWQQRIGFESDFSQCQLYFPGQSWLPYSHRVG